MPPKKVAAPKTALIDLKKLLHSRFDIAKFQSLVVDKIGGEEALADIYVGLLNDKELKGGAKSVISKITLEILQKKSADDAQNIPPMERLDAILNRYADQQEAKPVLCAKCRAEVDGGRVDRPDSGGQGTHAEGAGPGDEGTHPVAPSP